MHHISRFAALPPGSLFAPDWLGEDETFYVLSKEALAQLPPSTKVYCLKGRKYALSPKAALSLANASNQYLLDNYVPFGTLQPPDWLILN